MRHSTASPLFAVTVTLALLSAGLFGYGGFLHLTVKPMPVIGAAHAKPMSRIPVRHLGRTVAGKGKSAVAKSSSPSTGSADPVAERAFEAMLAGGGGLLLSALAGVSLAAHLRKTQAQTVQSLLRTERAAWEKQREVFDAQREALRAQLREAEQNKTEINTLRQHASRQFGEFFRTLPVACFCFAADGKIVRWNAACEALYGLLAAEAMETTLWDCVVPAEEQEAMTGWMQLVLAGESVLDIERRDRNAAGTTFPLLCSMVPLYSAEGEIIGGLSAGIDQTERTQHARQIAELGAALQQTREDLHQTRLAWEAQQTEAARTETPQPEAASADLRGPSQLPRDPVTGLHRREAFEERLRMETERAHRYNTSLSVIVLDLDGFRAYNKAFGIETGDLALQSVASLIESKIRTVDTAAHCEADLYALVLPETNEAGTRIAADRLRSGIAGLEWGQQPLTACFGAALLTPEVESSEMLLTQAMDALRRAKSLGPSSVACHGDTSFPAIRKSRKKESVT
jgi:diguanylate cyclase (GGDEF)-like protein/PAS domain S-box-containing protein